MGRKQVPPRRSARLEVCQLEDRALLSTALGSTHGGFLAATARVKGSQSVVRAVSPLRGAAKPLPAIPPIARLGYYLTTNTSDVAGFVPHFVQVDQGYLPALEAKLQDPNADVYVLVHGYAPGFETWVRNYAFGVGKLKGTGQILDWWQTIPSNYPGGKSNPEYKFVKSFDTNGAGAESPWLLDGYTTPGNGVESHILVAAQGLAPDLVASDPNAVVLAYSWLDDSATKEASIPIVGGRYSSGCVQVRGADDPERRTAGHGA